MSQPFDPIALIRTLDEHGVRGVLVGGLAAVMHGSPTTTNDADFVPDPTDENLARLADSLRDLGARIRSSDAPDGIEFDPHPALLGSMKMLNTTTKYGDFDLSFDPPGVDSYRDLERAATEFDIEGAIILVASLHDIIRSKEAADRPKDRAVLPILRALLDELERD